MRKSPASPTSRAAWGRLILANSGPNCDAARRYRETKKPRRGWNPGSGFKGDDVEYTRERALPNPHTLTGLRVDRYLAATRELIEASEGAGAEYEKALRRYELALTHIGGHDDRND